MALAKMRKLNINNIFYRLKGKQENGSKIKIKENGTKEKTVLSYSGS